MSDDRLENRVSPLAMSSEEFRKLGTELVNRIGDFLESLPSRPVTPAESPADIRDALGAQRRLPQQGADPGELLDRAADLLFDHSLFNGHPRFWGYVTSSAAPIGALGELLAAAVNPNVGAWLLSPMASEMEGQTVRWIAEMLGYSPECGGLFVSGGNMANFVCFLAARQAKAGWDVRSKGMNGGRLRIYCSNETHTWIQKAADISGMGTDAIRWVAVDQEMRMDVSALREQVLQGYCSGRQAGAGCGQCGFGEHGSGGPAAGAGGALQGIQSLVPCGWGLRRPGCRATGCAGAGWLECAKPTPWRWTRTSGCMRRSRPDVRWCGMRKSCAPRLPIIPCTITSATKPRIISTLAHRIRVDFAR